MAETQRSWRDGVTLQINLSPGDIAYAEQTVPALVRKHRASVVEVLAVVDCCRPQRTKAVDPDVRFPVEMFAERVTRITAIAESLRAVGLLDRVEYLRPDRSELLDRLSRRYTGGLIRETHDYGGTALMSYFAALELPETRWVLHYDADVLLHQATGFDWAAAAVSLMVGDGRIVAASPRISPPFSAATGAPDGPSRTEGLPFVATRGGWLGQWFSTRCFLMDRERLERYLPLPRGRVLLELLAVKLLQRGYPRSPELLFYRRIGMSGGRRLDLSDERAWIIHPWSKPAEYLELLPEIIAHVDRGNVPNAQRGMPEIDVPAWRDFLNAQPSVSADR